MSRSPIVAAAAALAVLWAQPAPARGQDLTVDTAGAAALIDQALNHSAVMQNLQYLTDVIGPRLTGSPAAGRANRWTLERFKAYGLDGHLEPWKFGGTWTRGSIRVRLTAPRSHDVTAASWAWAPGTGGATVTGPVVRIDASTPDSFAPYRRRVKGAWVMTRVPSLVWNNDGPPMTATDSARQRDFFRSVFTPFRDADSGLRARMQQFANDVPYLLHRAGALGILVDAGKEHALLNMSGSPNRPLPLPQIAVAHEDFALFDRLLGAGTTPRLAATLANTLTRDSVTQWTTVAEIPGGEHPGQVVIVGAHLDSWDLGTGATDNGTGAMCTLEAARAIAQSGLKPKRTIRFVLFTGEEQGLIGSRKYAAAHAGEADSIQAIIVLDNGTGAITGQALQGRADLEALWRAILVPVAGLGADSVVNRTKGGTDHLSFLPYGVPGFNFNQLERGYNHTHHSQSDTYDMAIPGDLMQASAVMAVSAYELANLPGMIPRGERSAPTPVQAVKISDSLVVKGKGSN
ncbi:MAG TPA: M20/M25/M40 family metallo-hydrolase [Gemmatimonadales bacterium]|nr:M20/M25/M40 family metallo-hydrolase [Gemmatimonadales bacterium]